MDSRIAQVEIIIYKIINNSPLFLLLKRTPARGGFWQAITGGVNNGEDLASAAKREMFEETQIKSYLKFISDVYYFEFDNEYKSGIKEYVFGAKVSQNIEAKLSSEHSEKKWCTFDEALKLLKYKTNKEAFRKLNRIINS